MNDINLVAATGGDRRLLRQDMRRITYTNDTFGDSFSAADPRTAVKLSTVLQQDINYGQFECQLKSFQLHQSLE